ncbi:GNAT superfamily N-acetyltransferase [Hydrogenophaga palleronii]|uniref:GNAT superfamily N-acetyltransferase n=1 Tax=Hydrogenophaga palleronii TaxID=65655 RepID=A0ABU1WM71_9BURK|nr:GNAT family N-acetyltransferase [Hydrogenophaga palleronii]MDR7150394.1 GNAT superfamily N-acetyltransferase [Hydrogenophaga palleronii]
MTIHVRQARPEDAAAACRVVRNAIEQCCAEDHEGDPARMDAWLRNKTPENFVTWIQRDDLYCVVAGGKADVIGFGMASAAGELLLCYVAPAVLHQGVGKALLQEIEQWASAAGLTELRLESTKTALAFYKRNDFVACGPAVSFAGMAGHPMRKVLPDAAPPK